MAPNPNTSFAQTQMQPTRILNYIDSRYGALKHLCLASSAPHSGGRDFFPQGPVFIVVRALEARLDTLNSMAPNDAAVNAFYDLHDNERNWQKMVMGMTTVLQVMEGSQGSSPWAVQALALMDRVEALFANGSSPQARSVFAELYLYEGDHMRLVRLLINVIYQMEQYGGRDGPVWSRQSSEEETLGMLLEGLVL